jgi:hypothetical protein
MNNEALNALNEDDKRHLKEIFSELYSISEDDFRLGMYADKELRNAQIRAIRSNKILALTKSILVSHHGALLERWCQYICGQVALNGFGELEPEIKKIKEEAEQLYLPPLRNTSSVSTPEISADLKPNAKTSTTVTWWSKMDNSNTWSGVMTWIIIGTITMLGGLIWFIIKDTDWFSNLMQSVLCVFRGC